MEICSMLLCHAAFFSGVSRSLRSLVTMCKRESNYIQYLVIWAWIACVGYTIPSKVTLARPSELSTHPVIACPERGGKVHCVLIARSQFLNVLAVASIALRSIQPPVGTVRYHWWELSVVFIVIECYSDQDEAQNQNNGRYGYCYRLERSHAICQIKNIFYLLIIMSMQENGRVQIMTPDISTVFAMQDKIPANSSTDFRGAMTGIEQPVTHPKMCQRYYHPRCWVG